MTLRLLQQLNEHATERPDAPAVIQAAPVCSAHSSMSFGELNTAVRSVAIRLRALTAPGSTILLCSPNRPEFPAAYLGALAAGMTVFPVSPSLPGPELNSAAQRSAATVLVGEQAILSRLHASDLNFIDINRVGAMSESGRSDPSHGNPAMLLQSSGTTGKPKIVRRTGTALDAVAASVCDAIQLLPTDRVLAAVPLYHSYGVEHGLLGPILAGCAVHLCEGFDPATISEQFARGGITVFGGVPFMFRALAERVIAMPDVRMIYSAGCPLPRTIYDNVMRTSGHRIGQLYGSTEAGSLTFNDPTRTGAYNPAKVGRPLNGVDLRILAPEHPRFDAPLPPESEGHVAVISSSMLAEYVDDIESPFTYGCFMTGDLGWLDVDGNLTISGRIKLQYDVGGTKVNPLEIEELICTFPGIRECVVVSVEVSEAVYRLKAVLILRKGMDVAIDDLRRFLRANIAPHKVPRLYEIRDELPRSATGKVQREALTCA